jgi:hypothetical protein
MNFKQKKSGGPYQEECSMKNLLRFVMYWCAILFVVWGSGAAAMAQSSGAACTRDTLKNITDQYFTALEAHNPSSLPLAATVKYTENGTEVKVGQGFWTTAGKTLLKRTLIDTQKCGTHSNVVIEEKYIAPKTVAPAAKPAAKAAFPGMEVKLPAER